MLSIMLAYYVNPNAENSRLEPLQLHMIIQAHYTLIQQDTPMIYLCLRNLTFHASLTHRVLEWSPDGQTTSMPLKESPFFTTTFDVWINKERRVERQIDTNSTKQAMIEGAEYTWESSAITASLLWRTIGKDNQPVDKFSGSVLCLGRPTDENVKAVVFQNYVTPVKEWQIRGEVPLSSTFNPTMKAGFLLPSEIRESEIICEPKQPQERGLNSLPTRGEDPPHGSREKKFFTCPR